MAEVGTLQYTIEVVDKNLKTSLNTANKSFEQVRKNSIAASNAVNNRLNKSFNSLKNASGVAKASLAGIGVALGAIGANAISVASDAEEIGSKFNVVFREIEDDANDWADSFANSVGRARQDIRSFSSGIGDILKPLGFATDEAFGLSTELTQLALDVASFNNKQDTDVIRSFTAAITGERESLKSLGIVISEADVQQEAYRAGLVAQGEELTKTAKAQATINLLYANTADAQGDLARTSDSFANQQKAFQATLKDFSETLGQVLLPAATKVLTVLNNLFKVLRDNPNVVKGIIVGISALAGAITVALIPAFIGAATAFGAFVIAAAPFLLIGAAIGAAIAGIIIYWDELKAATINYQDTLRKIGDFISNVFTNVVTSVGEFIQSITDKLIAFGPQLITLFLNPLGFAFTKLLEGFGVTFDDLKNLFINSLNSLAEIASNAADAFFTIGAGIASSLIAGVKSTIGALRDAIVSPIASAVSSARNLIGRITGGGSGGRAMGGMVPGFAKGGFTGGGAAQVAGVVHGGEWVAPKWMVNSMKTTFAGLDNIRRSGDTSNTYNYNITNNRASGDTMSDLAQVKFATKYA
jgi:hypothetical protein